MDHHRLALVFTVLAALGVRFGYIATTGHNVFAQSREGEIAHNIVAHGRWFVVNERAEEFITRLTASRNRLIDPGSVDYSKLDRNAHFYPESGESIGSGVVLAGLWTITSGERYLPLQVLQAILDALSALLVYRIALRLFKRRRAALLAAALYALYPPIAWDTVDPYNDIWAVDFTITIVAIYLEVLDSPHRWRWLIACGVLSGVAVYFRPNLLLIAPALALATVFRTGWREALRRGATIALIGALILLPWTVRNYEDFHAFIPTNSSMWEVMWGGLGEFPNDFGASLKTSVTKEEVRRVRPDLRFESPAWDAYLEPWVVHAIEHHPLFYLKTLAYRVAIATVWAHDQLWMHRGSPPVFTYKGGLLALIFERPLAVAQYMLQPLAFLLAMLALGFTWRGRRAHHLILIATVLAVLVPYIAISVESRYLLPAAFAYFIWIGLGADLLMQGIQARSASVPTAAPRRTWTAVR